MLLTRGSTQSDPSRRYSNCTDRYRPGAGQRSVTIALDGDGDQHTAQDRVELAFLASNAPAAFTHPTAAAIHEALAEQVTVPLRSLSVGDAVAAHGQTRVCGPTGRRRIEDTDSTAAARRYERAYPEAWA